MSSIVKIIMTVFLLIAIGLVLWNASASVNIINAMAKNSIQGIKTLQGRG